MSGSPYSYQTIDQTGSSSGSQDSSYELTNLAITTSVSGNALTIAVKDKSGSDPSVPSPVNIAFRSATITSGVYVQRVITSALSVVVSSGSTLGTVSAVASYLYVYAIDNAGTVELGVCNGYLDEGSLQTSTAEGGAGAADLAGILYSTTARTAKAIRIIGRILITEATAGTWASNATELAVQPFPAAHLGYYRYIGSYPNSASNYWSRTSTSYGDFTVVGTIPTIAVAPSGNNGITVANATSSLPGCSFTAPRTGVIRIDFDVIVLPGQEVGQVLWGVRLFETTTAAVIGTERGGGFTANSASNMEWQVRLTAYLAVTAGTAYNIKVQSKMTSGTFYIGAYNNAGDCLAVHLTYVT